MQKKLSTTTSNLSNKLVTLNESRTVYNGFFSVKEFDVSFTKFDGSKSEIVTRSALISLDAVIILPYDPIHDRVLLVEQFQSNTEVSRRPQRQVCQQCSRNRLSCWVGQGQSLQSF